MTLADIAGHRLISQQIAGSRFQSPKALVAWMGAMQAQDYAMSKWAAGVRMPGKTEKQIEAAIDKGEILRTHVLRPTWHLVSPDDIHWMLELSAPRIKSSMKARDKELELDESIYNKSNAVIEKALSKGGHLTREQLMAELALAGIATDNNRSSHLLLRAELEGLICSGASNGKKHTYAHLETRPTKRTAFHEEEALEKLARTYFTSHGPASLQDFTWWSGLAVAEARQALELVRKDFVSETIGCQTFWFPDSYSSLPTGNHPSVYLLPAFDEFIISYTERSATLTFENHQRTISRNGLFWPVIVINGQVTGLWKRVIKNDKVTIHTDLFIPHNKSLKKHIQKAAENFGHFLELKTEVIFPVEQSL